MCEVPNLSWTSFWLSSSFSVDEFDCMLSDTHTPITISIVGSKSVPITQSDMSKLSDNTSTTTCDVSGDRPDFVLKWVADHNKKFENSFTDQDLENLKTTIDSISLNPTQIGVDNFTENLKELLINKAKHIGAL